jgi:hypothetical protein
VDGELLGGKLRRLQRHLAECEQCVTELELIRETVVILRSVPMVSAPRSFAVPRSMVPARAWRPATAWSVQAAGLAAIFVVAIMVSGALAGVVGGRGPDAPIQVGMTEPAPLVTVGGQPDPGAAVPTGEVSSSRQDAVVPADPLGRYPVWLLAPLGIATVAAGLFLSIVLRRRRRFLP